jgi:DNA-binding Lrp family transcriptional regulator
VKDIDRRLIHHLSGDLGDSLQPLADLARQLGLAEEEVLAKVESFQARGLIRRFGFTLNHQRSGFAANALVVWRVGPARLTEVGAKLAARPQVSHCYQRRTAPDWPYDRYPLVHAGSRAELERTVAEMAAAAGVDDWRVLESLKELKKTSLRYFEAETAPAGAGAPGLDGR